MAFFSGRIYKRGITTTKEESGSEDMVLQKVP